MNTLISVGLFMCVFVAYASALPYPSEVVAESVPKNENLAVIDTESKEESLVPAESAWGGHGWGHGRGWGHGGGLGHLFGHHFHHGGHHFHHGGHHFPHGGHHWFR